MGGVLGQSSHARLFEIEDAARVARSYEENDLWKCVCVLWFDLVYYLMCVEYGRLLEKLTMVWIADQACDNFLVRHLHEYIHVIIVNLMQFFFNLCYYAVHKFYWNIFTRLFSIKRIYYFVCSVKIDQWLVLSSKNLIAKGGLYIYEYVCYNWSGYTSFVHEHTVGSFFIYEIKKNLRIDSPVLAWNFSLSKPYIKTKMEILWNPYYYTSVAINHISTNIKNIVTKAKHIYIEDGTNHW